MRYRSRYNIAVDPEMERLWHKVYSHLVITIARLNGCPLDVARQYAKNCMPKLDRSIVQS